MLLQLLEENKARSLPRSIIVAGSVAKSGPTLCDPKDGSMPDSPVLQVSWNLLKFMSMESMMLPDHPILTPKSPKDFNVIKEKRQFRILYYFRIGKIFLNMILKT